MKKEKKKEIKDNQPVDYWREVNEVNVQYKLYASCICSQEKKIKKIYIYLASGLLAHWRGGIKGSISAAIKLCAITVM